MSLRSLALQRCLVSLAAVFLVSACTEHGRKVPLSGVEVIDIPVADISNQVNQNINNPTLQIPTTFQVADGDLLTLVWNDEFDGAQLDPETWFFATGDGSEMGLPPGWGNNELQYYLPDNAQLVNGVLEITARRESADSYNFTSGRINTQDRFAFRYGRVEASIKFPSGQGLWPAFWMLSQNSPYGEWAATGEIDIVEAVNLDGTGGNEIFATIHFGGAAAAGQNTSTETRYTPSFDVTEDFHTYAFEWDESEMRWYVDGTLYKEENSWSSAAAPYPAPFDQPFHILFNVAVGGNFPGSPNVSTPLPATMEVDWVRVYSGEVTMAEAIPVELRQTEDGWQLLRGGEPYFIRGAGGSSGSLEALAAAGANSIRIWDAQDIGARLDAAHELGLSATVGIWLGHERHGFDYNDEAQVSEQLERARQAVLRYKDHPAVLLWGVGNEMEGYESGDSPAVWAAVNDMAAMIKQIDPHHPTMTVTAELGGGRIESVHQRSPAIDIHGINSYGGAPSLPERLRAGGATKPYVITEFGPVGTWEMPKTEWGAPYEQTSTEKAEFYRQSYESGVVDAPGRALGSYAFLWGHKMEGTETWFGMLLEDGSRLGAVDVMTELWSGDPPADLAPTVERLVIDGNAQVDPGAEVQVSTVAADPEGGSLDVRWVLRPESGETNTGGDFRPNLPAIEGAVLEGRSDGATIRMPEEPGAYRLFYYAYDEAGNAATANVPLLVEGKPRMHLPVSVYEDSFEGMP